MKPKFLYFDCMDTLIQMAAPSMEVYADWAFLEASRLGLWEDASSFRRDWNHQKERLLSESDGLREGTILGRIRKMLEYRLERSGLEWSRGRVEEEASRIHRGYWKRYRSATYVKPEVHETLGWIQTEAGLPMGVVSNFMVEGGVPTLLSDHRLDRFFKVVLVSCDIGWRKPSEVIYEAAIRSSGFSPFEILFIGDNILADYQGPRILGMNALLYDPKGIHRGVNERIESFPEIRKELELS